jgi:hypothetical protein
MGRMLTAGKAARGDRDGKSDMTARQSVDD